jgi:hypothetical protein
MALFCGASTVKFESLESNEMAGEMSRVKPLKMLMMRSRSRTSEIRTEFVFVVGLPSDMVLMLSKKREIEWKALGWLRGSWRRLKIGENGWAKTADVASRKDAPAVTDIRDSGRIVMLEFL